MSLDLTPAEAALADPPTAAANELPRRTITLMAVACGASAANIFYNQPLLGDFARGFGASEFRAGLVATAAQVGYGLGLLFFVPLGDGVDRRRLVIGLTLACALALVGAAAAPTLGVLIAMQCLVGAFAMSAQLLIPLAVDLTPPPQRGRTIGTLMGGLLAGVLLARTFSGIIADRAGWRATFALAAVTMILLAAALARGLPPVAPPARRLPYARLMRSLPRLLLDHPALWVVSAISGLSFGAFIGFWTALPFLMATRFHKGATETGLFGIVGLIGALAAPLAGRVSDRRGTSFTIVCATLIAVASFALMGAWVTIAGLVVGVLAMDLGVQSIQVAGQSTVMALAPEARARTNTIYMVVRFTGGAAGSAASAALWTWRGWPAVCLGAMLALSVALIIQLAFDSRQRRLGAP